VLEIPKVCINCALRIMQQSHAYLVYNLCFVWLINTSAWLTTYRWLVYWLPLIQSLPIKYFRNLQFIVSNFSIILLYCKVRSPILTIWAPSLIVSRSQTAFSFVWGREKSPHTKEKSDLATRDYIIKVATRLYTSYNVSWNL